MTHNDFKRTPVSGDVIVGSLALATLILADKVAMLHLIFGLPLFIYFLRDFKKASSLAGRLIVSMAISFVTLLFTCYPLQLILNHIQNPPDWDILLAIQWFIVFLLTWSIRELFNVVNSRGEE